MEIRKVPIERDTTEVDIKGELCIDGEGNTDVTTGIDRLDHMLPLFAFHGFFDLKIKAKEKVGGDLHHINEDLGIALGKAFKSALGDKKGIKRIGFAYVPMGKALSRVVVDISGRGELGFSLLLPESSIITWAGGIKLNFSDLESGEIYGLAELQSFLEAFTKNSGITINIGLLQRENTHHQLEAIFKALGIALDEATQIDPRRKGIPSTKGVID